MAIDSFQAIAAFVKVAEARSFTKAGHSLRMTPSGVSKVITRLEGHLGVRLVNRTTRSVSLTADGDEFFERCRQILAELREAESAVAARGARLKGRLRIQTPVAFGRKIVVPLLAEFVRSHQGLTVDLEMSDRVPDLAEEGIDVAVRIGEIHSSSVVVRRLCSLRYLAVASPDYIERFGEPAKPDDLGRHRCLAYYEPHVNRYREWHFAGPGGDVSTTVHGALNINSAEGLLEAAIAGAGIATLSGFIAADAIAAGKLRVVLRDQLAEGPMLSIVYLSRRHMSLRARTFVDYLCARMSPPPWEAVVL